MFYTTPGSEFPLPLGTRQSGERAWRWMELGVKAPYYFVTGRSSTDEGWTVQRHFWFCELAPLKELACAAVGSGSFQMERVDIFSPGFLNQTGAYRLDRVKEIWQSTEHSSNLRILLVNGEEMVLNVTGIDEPDHSESFELVLSI